jgi:hypothetical protein
MIFRAKDKVRFKGNDAIPLGWVHVGGDEFFWETHVGISLKHGKHGVPCWNAKTPAEHADRRRFGWAKGILNGQITPSDGEFIAAWLRGDQLQSVPSQKVNKASERVDIADLLQGLENVGTEKGLSGIDDAVRPIIGQLDKAQVLLLNNARKAALARISAENAP